MCDFLIVTVLKSGGDYHQGYLHSLKQQLDRTQLGDYRLVCFSDMKVPEGVARIGLKHDLPGWWSKLEIFRLTTTVVYVDLDTTIFKDVSELARKAKETQGFYMLEGFGSDDWASGIMAWSGDYSFILKEHNMDEHRPTQWDQHWIKGRLNNHGVFISSVQAALPGIYSYKNKCRYEIPKDCRIVCFHGKPRPEQVGFPFYEQKEIA